MISYVCHQLIQMYIITINSPKQTLNGDAQINLFRNVNYYWRKHCHIYNMSTENANILIARRALRYRFCGCKKWS